MIETRHVAELDGDRAELAFPAMKELRPHLTGAAELVERVRQQRAEGYHSRAASCAPRWPSAMKGAFGTCPVS